MGFIAKGKENSATLPAFDSVGKQPKTALDRECEDGPYQRSEIRLSSSTEVS